jgi:hypothetical protein
MKSVVWLVIPSLALAAAGPIRAQEPAVTGVSAARLQSRQDLVESLIAAAEAGAGRRLDEGYRAGFKARLAALPEAAWQELERSRDLGVVKVPLGGSPGSARLIYRTVPPCRILDTRLQGGSLAAGSPRAFQVTGIDLSPQGGNAAGCGVPFGPAVGALINFVAVNPTGPGNLRAWNYSGSVPTASILNYTSGLNLANGIAIPICDPSPVPTACQRDFYVQADVNASHLVADVVGYFERFPKSQVRSFSEIDNTATATPIDTSCTHVAGADVTLVAPVAGRVIVRASVPHRIQQAGGGDRVLVLGIAEADNDCNFTNFSHSKVKNDSFTEDFLMTVPVVATFTVTAGTHNFYLNGRMTSGPNGSAVVVPGTLVEATFHPN